MSPARASSAKKAAPAEREKLDLDLSQEFGERKRVRLANGNVVTLPPSLPVAAIQQLQDGRSEDMLVSLFGEKQKPLVADIGYEEVMAIFREVYGMNPGESPGS